MKSRFRKILIVDDDPLLAKTLADILRFKRYEVCVAHSGAAALQALGAALKEQSVRPPFLADCVISDVKMPGMNGVALFRKIHNCFPSLPMVLMTAYTEEHLLQEALDEGVLEVMIKPLNIPRLLTLLEGG
jgi:CheY-like chemotaxis protein